MNHLKELESATKRGKCVHLVYDDDGRWAASDGSASASGPRPDTIIVYVEPKAWKRTPDKAIEWYLKRESPEGQKGE